MPTLQVRTYYTYVSEEVKQFAWGHVVTGRARICIQISTLKATGFLLHQVYMSFSQSAVGAQMGRKIHLIGREIK